MPEGPITGVPGSQSGVSRRNFIKGVIAAGATVSASAYLFRANIAGQDSALPGSVERLITLNVNGTDRRVDVAKHETLAMTLRYKLGLTGTKIGCDRAECGACTVLVDDVPHYSCSVLTHTVRGKKIVSIEGLAASDGTLHPVQQAVVNGQGFQCAFCMGDAAYGFTYVLHGLTGVGFVGLIIAHIYFALRPEKLWITKAMIFGYITRRQYLEHHDPDRWRTAS